MNLGVILEYWPRLLEGAWLTVELVAISLLIGGALALPLALMRVSESLWLRAPAYAYIFFFRGTPLLIQIFLIYYGPGQFEAVRDSLVWTVLREPYWCALIALSLNTAAYTAEVLRGGIQGVPAGQVEAARAFGMSRALAYRRIVLPQAYRLALPAYGNEVILTLKGSALASTITLLDLTGQARTVVARTYMPVEIFFAAGCLYLVMTFVVVQVVRLVERRLAPGLRRPMRLRPEWLRVTGRRPAG
jgi:putative lysine/arginine/ornithine/histidine/octopine transport system permease protein